MGSRGSESEKATVSVTVLGELALEVDGRPLDPIASHRARSLLAWLAVHPGLHPRGRVAGLFWPDVLEESARSSLRTTLATLRRELGEEGAGLVTASRERVGIEPGPEVRIDLQSFERLLASGELEQAAALCRGDLLADLDDDWVNEPRERHRQRQLEVLGRLAEEAERSGDFGAALDRTREQVRLDPLSEEAQRELVRRLAAAGDRAAALAAYQAYGARLQRELGLAPSAGIRELAEGIRRGEAMPHGAADKAQAAAPEPETDAAQSSPAPLPPMLARPEPAPMVGREAELEQLRSALARAAEGDLCAVLISGEAGGGKSRLAAEFAREAHGSGADIWAGRCYEDSAAPYGPFVESLRHRLTADALPGLPDWAAAELSRLLPELPGSDAASSDSAGDPEEARYRLFEAVVSVVAGSSDRAPILLVLEDLHWADHSTLLLLAHLTRTASSSPILVLGTARDSEPCPDGLTTLIGELAHDRRLVRIAIEGLSEAEVGELASGWLSEEQPPGLAAELRARTGGNPLFVEELLRHAQDADRLDEAGLAPGVPAEVREVISQRVDRLGKPSAEALAFGAILGHEFEIRELAESIGRQTDDLVESLDAALGARLLNEVPRGAGRYRFSHDLVRETLYRELSAARRSLLHLWAADAIERLHGDDPKRLPELARHLADAGPAGDPERAVRYLLAAAEQAGHGWATAEAIELYNQALALIPEDDEGLRSEVRLKQAMAYAAFTHIQIGDAQMNRSA
jgi:DNA-binding SARP family transcriptional activator/tetratricopeptide (TPR) repeat protein